MKTPHRPKSGSSHANVLGALLAKLALGLALLGGCSDDNPSDPNKCAPGDSICAGQLPRLATQPGDPRLEIVDAGMRPGDTQLRTIRVINVGERALDLRNVALEYTPPEGGQDGNVPAFKLQPLVSQLPVLIEIFGGDKYPQGVDVVVEYTKGNDSLPRTATLVLTSDDRFFTDGGVTRIELTTDVGAPSLTVNPNPVDFGLVPRSEEPVARRLTLLNTGSRALNVTGFKIKKDGRFGFRSEGSDDFEAQGDDAFAGVDLETPINVPAGETRPMEVTFLSDSPTPAEGELLIFSDDPQTGAAGLLVNLTANKNGPCVDVTPRRIAFGGKIVGSVSRIDFELRSCGTEPVRITDIGWKENSSPDFNFVFDQLPEGFESGPSPSNVLSIPINTSVTIGVEFVPDGVNPRDADNVPIPDEAIALVSSNAFESKLEIEVTGAGAEVECPTPIIVVEEGEEVIPQTVIHLDGRQSFAPFGSIDNYFWSVVAPEGAPRPILVPSFTDPQPVVELNTVGLYTFKLKVRDEFGNSSGNELCPDAEYQVLVQPDQAIHVELTWVTPNDPDEADTGEGNGTDLDLHFAHRDAVGPDLDGDGAPDPWFDRNWDVFWFNVEPQWGTFDPNVRDDPRLDRDDIDGGGPENLNLAMPEDDIAYRIGVHFWNDFGFGPVNATVKVFHYADEIYNVTYESLKRLDMWCVGDILWPTPAVIRCAGEGEPEKVTPNYVNMFFQPF
jgi:hypothetical protein